LPLNVKEEEREIREQGHRFDQPLDLEELGRVVGVGEAHLVGELRAAVLDLVTVPRRRWILERTWDRFQIPKPFSRIDLYFADPLFPREDEEIEEFRRRIEVTLNDLEQIHDAAEAVFARLVARPRTRHPGRA